MKKVVQFITNTNIYTTGMQQELERNELFCSQFENVCLCEIDIMHDFEKKQGISDFSKLNIISRLVYWIKLNHYMCVKYGNLKGGIVNIQYVSRFYVWILPFLTKVFDRIILSFWGSDLLRQNDKELRLLKLLVRRAYAITFPTSDMADVFKHRVGNAYNERIHIVRFGNYYLERIDKANKVEETKFVQDNHIDIGRKIVVVGYNRNKEHQHLKAIESIINYEIDRNRIFIVIPWTYGTKDEDYRNELEELVRGNYDYVFLTKQLTDDEVVSLRCITDILIIVQTTDALNATMLETMYAGGDVIVGKWLPYNDIYNLGVRTHQVDSPSDVGKMLDLVCNNPMTEDAKRQNKVAIRDLYTWRNIIGGWIKLYL